MASFKAIREEASTVLKHIAAELLAVANAQELVESRQSVAIGTVSIPSAQVWLRIILLDETKTNVDIADRS